MAVGSWCRLAVGGWRSLGAVLTGCPSQKRWVLQDSRACCGGAVVRAAEASSGDEGPGPLGRGGYSAPPPPPALPPPDDDYDYDLPV